MFPWIGRAIFFRSTVKTLSLQGRSAGEKKSPPMLSAGVILVPGPQAGISLRRKRNHESEGGKSKEIIDLWEALRLY